MSGALTFSAITDRCVCGAEFKAEGMPSWVGTQHEKWLEAHAGCRFNANVNAGLVAAGGWADEERVFRVLSASAQGAELQAVVLQPATDSGATEGDA